MEFDQVIKTRFSCRNFSSEEIDNEKIEEILKAAILAPSSGNVQDWRFAIVKDEKIKEKIADACFGQNFIKKAPVIILIFSDLEEIGSHYGERGKNVYSYLNAGGAIENLMLKATDLGLATCFIGAFSEEKIREIFSFNENIKPIAIIPLGYCLDSPSLKSRKKLEEVIIFRK